MSATIAYSSAPLTGFRGVQFRDAFVSTTATLNPSIASSVATRLPSVDFQAHGELIYGEIRAISGDELLDFGRMIPRQLASLVKTFDRAFAATDALAVYSSEIDAIPSLIFENGLDETFEMSSSVRKDLFIAVTLPLLGMGAAIFAAVGGSYIYTLSATTRLDDSLKAVTALVSEQSKGQAVANAQISTISKNSEDSSAKLDKVVDQLNQMNATLLVMKSQKEEKMRNN